MQTETAEIARGGVAGCFLKIVEGKDLGRTLDLPEGVALVGTRETCDIRLEDATVSGEHVRVEATASGLNRSASATGARETTPAAIPGR
jgi:hypothetical protein